MAKSIQYSIVFPCVVLFLFLLPVQSISQQGPWNNPLRIAYSSDGQNFGTTSIFQDSSGVPSFVKWKGDTLACVFQWFRQPNPSPSWDRVAVKFSYDNGTTWTQPQPIVVNGLPPQYQRPFDPTLAVLNNDSMRIFFSSSNGIPMGLDSTIDTYSAVTTDGVNYLFDSGPRFNHPTNRVIDPSVIRFKGLWHYTAPKGAPQDGAYHAISNDGFHFNQVQDITSDQTHNWTGNLMVMDTGQVRFYGGGGNIWFNASPNGGQWLGYTNTNLQGGDPCIQRVDSNQFIAIYVGQPYTVSIEPELTKNSFQVYPNPAKNSCSLQMPNEWRGDLHWEILSLEGRVISDGSGLLDSGRMEIPLSEVSPGMYLLRVNSGNGFASARLEIF